MIEYNKSYVEYEEGDPLEVDTKEDLIEKIKQCEKIAIIRGHGGYEGTSLSYITITDKAETDQETLSSDDVYADNIYDMDLSNIEIILYVGCSTAGNYNTAGARNLLNSSVAHGGALISVGFSQTIICGNGNTFATTFASEYATPTDEAQSQSFDLPTLLQDEKFRRYWRSVRKAADVAQLKSKCVVYYNGTYLLVGNY